MDTAVLGDDGLDHPPLFVETRSQPSTGGCAIRTSAEPEPRPATSGNHRLPLLHIAAKRRIQIPSRWCKHFAGRGGDLGGDS
jgi:hypothetical protein